jgi:trehalose/maltose hydrolase-like predicted phosphorylase
MAVWVIEKALHILDTMIANEEKEALLLKIRITEDEIARWRDIIQKMTIPIDKSGLIHQFEGYMDLKELDWDEYRRKYDNIHRIDRILKAEGLSPDSYKVAKQADVLMLFYVLNKKELSAIFTRLGYPFSKDTMKKNFEYYFPRTSHGSTLSMIVHAYIANLLGYEEKAMEYFMDTLRSDIYDTQGGTTQEGIHAGVMGGTLDYFLRGYAGLRLLEDRVCLDPKLPNQWQGIKFHLRYKNIWFDVAVTKKDLTISAKPLKETSLMSVSEIPVEIRKKIYKLIPGESCAVPI